MTKRILIPPITDRELKRWGHIRPVMVFHRQLYYIKPGDPRNESFVWDAKRVERADKISPIQDIRTYHGFSYHGFFKPSVAEVLAQIPKELLPEVAAFEIIKRPENAANLNEEKEALNQGFHVATTRLYWEIKEGK